MHSFVERKLIERVGDAGRRLHTGRSRNEQVSLDLRLYLRRRIPAASAAGRTALVAACADQAEQSAGALMPSYTHLRRAQPVLVAHFFLSHASALRRDHARLAAAADEADALTLGSGAVAGTSYPVDTARLARALGFSRVVLNSMDASSDRDFVASFLYAASLAMVHLSRLAEDLIIFTGEEHGFFELSDASATGSSMMPQKKNPDPLELVRGKTGRAVGRLTGWLVTMKGLPERVQQGPAGGQGGGLRRRSHARVVAACGACRGGAAVDERIADRAGGVGPVARHRRRRLSRARGAFHFDARTKSSAPWSAACSRRDATSAISPWRNGGARARCSAKTPRARPRRWPRCRRAGRRSRPIRTPSVRRSRSAGAGSRATRNPACPQASAPKTVIATGAVPRIRDGDLVDWDLGFDSVTLLRPALVYSSIPS